MTKLIQLLFSNEPEPNQRHFKSIPVQEFIALVRAEEEYWPGDETNTRLSITRLRKIFYDKWGWDEHLIRGAAKIEGRYNVAVLDKAVEGAKKMRWHKNEEEQPKYRKVT